MADLKFGAARLLLCRRLQADAAHRFGVSLIAPAKRVDDQPGDAGEVQLTPRPSEGDVERDLHQTPRTARVGRGGPSFATQSASSEARRTWQAIRANGAAGQEICRANTLLMPCWRPLNVCLPNQFSRAISDR